MAFNTSNIYYRIGSIYENIHIYFWPLNEYLSEYYRKTKLHIQPLKNGKVIEYDKCVVKGMEFNTSNFKILHNENSKDIIFDYLVFNNLQYINIFGNCCSIKTHFHFNNSTCYICQALKACISIHPTLKFTLTPILWILCIKIGMVVIIGSIGSNESV